MADIEPWQVRQKKMRDAVGTGVQETQPAPIVDTPPAEDHKDGWCDNALDTFTV